MQYRKRLVACALTVASLATALGAQSHGDERMISTRHSSGSATITVDGGHVSLHGSGSGVLIESAVGRFADEGVLQPGDVILAVDGTAVGVPEDLFGYVRAHPRSESFEITVEREGNIATRRLDRSFFQKFMTPRPPAIPTPPPIPGSIG